MTEAPLTTQQLAELHLHLEGTIRRETGVALSSQNGLPAPPAYEYSDLPGFLNVYGQVSRCMVTSQEISMPNSRASDVRPRTTPSIHPAAGCRLGLKLISA